MTAWTKDAPTAPGWYWWRKVDDPEHREVIEIGPRMGDGVLTAWRTCSDIGCSPSDLDGEWWPEPIPSPEEVAALRDAAKIMGDGMRDLRDRLASERAKAEAWQRVAEEMRDELISIVAGEVDVAALVYDAAVARHLGGTGT